MYNRKRKKISHHLKENAFEFHCLIALPKKYSQKHHVSLK
jgi:hypothetical protein